MARLLVAILFVLFLPGPGVGAETPTVLDWESLVPPGPPIDDPARELASDLGIELGLIASIRAKRRNGLVTEGNPEAEWGLELERKFQAKGLDLENLLERQRRMQAEVARRNSEVNASLDGKLVRIPGYVLPLEFDGTQVGEFLLVPFVGACIHVPAPPRNQMVFVRLTQSYAAKALYEPVWVTGRLRTAGATKRLSLVDGSANIDTGYTMDGTRVDPYKD
jgi:hypothetical protein